MKDHDGMWHFKADFSPSRNAGFVEEWWTKTLELTGDVIKMPVPSSFNDIIQDVKLRDFIGWVWYERNFWVPNFWLQSKQRVFLLFESAHYNTRVWVNGKEAMAHEGGHLPFQAEVGGLLAEDKPNRVTVAINNTLTPSTLPCGSVKYMSGPKYPPGYFVQNLQLILIFSTTLGSIAQLNCIALQRSMSTTSLYIALSMRMAVQMWT